MCVFSKYSLKKCVFPNEHLLGIFTWRYWAGVASDHRYMYQRGQRVGGRDGLQVWHWHMHAAVYGMIG